jgi:hypothetical protein
LPGLKEFIPGLVKAWNSNDHENILADYSEDFELLLPVAKNRLGLENGILKGKSKVREWWRRVLEWCRVMKKIELDKG